MAKKYRKMYFCKKETKEKIVCKNKILTPCVGNLMSMRGRAF